MIKSLPSILALIFLFSSAYGQGGEMVLDKIVAKVGDQYVLKSEIEQSVDYAQAQKGTDIDEEEKCMLINELLVQSLLVNQAAQDSIIVSDEEVDAELDRKIEYILNLMGNDTQKFMEYYGKTVGEVRSSFRNDLKKQLVAQRMHSSITAQTDITPQEVIDFFNKIPKDSLPYFNSEVEVGEIVIYPKVNEEERKKAEDALTQIRENIMSGNATFEDMATQYSSDPGSGRQGGDLGWTKRGSFVPEFEAAAFELSPGEVSDLVETPFGFHLIKLVERRGNNIWVKHILIAPLITPADEAKAKLLADSVATAIRDSTISWEAAVKKYSSEDVQSYNNGGRMINPASGTTFFETPDLDPDVFFALDSLELGAISDPVRFSDQRRDQSIFRILKLFSRSSPHQANLEQDFDKIKQAAISERKSGVLDKWVDKTISKTYIELDDDYVPNDCEPLKMWHVYEN